GVPERHAVAPARVAPGDRAFPVAGHVAGAALEAALVAEDDRAVREQAEEVGRAGLDAGVQSAVLADLAVHYDVRLRVGAEADAFELLCQRGPHHPKARPPSYRSRRRRRTGTPARLSSARASVSSLRRGRP